MNNLFLIAIILIAFLVVVQSGKTNMGQKDYQPEQHEIQDLTYVDKTQYIQDYPYPQISREFKKLSRGVLPSPLNNESEILPVGDKNLKYTRNTMIGNMITKQRMYLPDFYRKDRLGGNDIGTEELRPFVNNKDKSEQSWTDENISDHPAFYNATIKDELTNIGSFFDKNNQYNDKTSSNTEALPSDTCYIDKMGRSFCEDSTRLQLIPPKLITDPRSCYALNEVGIYKDKRERDDVNDRVMNGGSFYNGVNASLKKNESWSAPIQTQVGDCAI